MHRRVTSLGGKHEEERGKRYDSLLCFSRGRTFSLLFPLFAFLFPLNAHAEEPDSLRHLGFSVELNPASVLALDTYQRKWQKRKGTFSLVGKLNYNTSADPDDPFAQDYDYPIFSLGLRLTHTNATMHRSQDPDWGLAQEVDYDSHLGNLAALYLEFTRTYWRHGRWGADYSIGTGVGYAPKIYNKLDNIDDELIGSHFLIYFTAGTHLTYRLSPHWGLRAGIDFFHHSNGALYRPNKGSNIAGPSLGVTYYPQGEDNEKLKIKNEKSEPFPKDLTLKITAGVGGKTLLEDWLNTQFYTSPDSANYRTDHFHFYMAYSLQADVMYRYARRWASGIGIDAFYGTYADHLEEVDNYYGHPQRHSPWSFGVSLKHQAFYHNLSVAGSIGGYVFRHMGENAKYNESWLYERIGVHYQFPSLGGLEIGLNVKAHLTKADLTEFVVAYPITLYRKH